MPKATLSESTSDFTVMAPETVIGVKVDETEVVQLDGKYGPWEKLEVKFTITDAPEPYKSLIDKPIWGGIPFRFEDDPENPMLQWTEAILGFDIAGNLGFQIDTDDWHGKSCRAVVGNYQKRNGATRHTVVSLLPASNELSAPNAEWPPKDEGQTEAQKTAASTTTEVPDEDLPF